MPPSVPPAVVVVPQSTLGQELMKDVWVHIGGLVAIGCGFADLWQFHGLSRDTDLLVIAAGFLAQGVKIVNGSAAAAASAAAGTIGSLAIAQAQAVRDTAISVSSLHRRASDSPALPAPAAEPVNSQVLPAAPPAPPIAGPPA